MSGKYCTSCGKERGSSAIFCGSCGTRYSTVQQESAAVIESHAVEVKKPKTMMNIGVNILTAVFMFSSHSAINRHMEWGGGESYVVGLLLIMLVLQSAGLLLHKKRSSYSLLIPTIISFVSIFMILSLYRDFSAWAEYTGYDAGIEAFIMLIYLIFYIAVTIVNTVFLFIRTKKN